MKINYNINHELLTHDALKDLKGKQLLVTWLVWSQIMHICWHTKSKTCEFYQGQFSEDLKISDNTTKAALTHLINLDLIKCVRQYSQKGLLPGMYVLTQSSIRPMQKQYQKANKAVSPSDTVNNINNIIRGDVKSHTPNNEKMVTSSDLKKPSSGPNPILEEYNKLKQQK
jgi:hypothetical protein